MFGKCHKVLKMLNRNRGGKHYFLSPADMEFVNTPICELLQLTQGNAHTIRK